MNTCGEEQNSVRAQGALVRPLWAPAQEAQGDFILACHQMVLQEKSLMGGGLSYAWNTSSGHLLS